MYLLSIPLEHASAHARALAGITVRDEGGVFANGGISGEPIKRVAVEIQFGKYSFIAYDLFVKHMAFYVGDAIDVGG